MSNPRLRLCTFGGLTLAGADGVPLAGAAGQRRRLAVLAVLAVAGARPTSRDRLLALLWPEREAAGGRQALSQALYALRRAAGGEPLVVGAGTETLRLDPALVSADVTEFEAAIARGAPSEAAGLYAGPFLDGVHLGGDAGAFERWADGERARLGALAGGALERLAADAEGAGDHAAAARWWRRLTELDPLDARAAAGLVRAHDALGDRGRAARHAERHARRVREELGAAPPAIERARADALAPPDAASARRSFAPAPDRAPAGAPTGPRLAPPPAPPVALVGRSRELTAAHALLRRASVRLLTLTGAGGSGKTSLALQLARDASLGAAPESDLDGPAVRAGASDSREGDSPAFAAAAFVDLSSVRDAALVLPAVAAALGVHDREGLAIDAAIAAALAQEAERAPVGGPRRRMLLVLDNMEQVLAAAPDVARLLAAAPALTVLATSRAPLRVRGEHEFFVAPLAVPDLARPAGGDALRASPSVALFLERAREARPDLTFDAEALGAVAEICVRLDGLPLAVELAAARTRLLAPRAILARLSERRLDLLVDGPRDLPARQRTLRGAVAWSYDLLNPRQRAALRALGVFAGPFRLAAAAAVVGAGEDDALALAQVLVEGSLLRRAGEDADGPRLAMLETIREFARERLRAEGEEAAARDRHLAHHLAQAERLAPALAGAAQGDALSALERQRDDLRAALEWAAEARDPALLVRFALALWRAWLVGGRWTEGREWIARALARADDAAARAELLGAATALAQNQGDYEAAYDAACEALVVWRAQGDRAGEARTLVAMGWLGWRRGRYADARRLSRAGLALHETLGDDAGAARARGTLGWVAIFEGAHAEAAEELSRALAVRRRLGDRRELGFTLTALAWAALRRGGRDIAVRHLAEAVALCEAIGERQLRAFAMLVCGEAALTEGRADEARATVARDCVPVFGELGDRWGLCNALGVLGDAELAAGRLEEAEAAYADSAALARALGDGYAAATAEARAALLGAARGDRLTASARGVAAARRMAEVGGALAPWIGARLAAAGVAFDASTAEARCD